MDAQGRNDLSPERSPIEAGLGFFCDLEKGGFIGRMNNDGVVDENSNINGAAQSIAGIFQRAVIERYRK